MGELTTLEDAGKEEIVVKEEALGLELPFETTLSRHIGDNVASSSGTNVRLFFMGMGFLPSIVDKVISEKGEENVDLLLETLFGYSEARNLKLESSDSMGNLLINNTDRNPPEIAAKCYSPEVLRKSNSQSSDSLDSLFGDKDVPSSEISTFSLPKEEPDKLDGVNAGIRASLLAMNFSVIEVEFAINKLGENAPVNELVDFIIANQIAEKIEDVDDTTHGNNVKNEDVNNEVLFGTMDKTLRLLEMGFSENEVSLAVERFGSDAPIAELANWIVTGPTAGSWVRNNKFSSKFKGNKPFGIVKPEEEDFKTEILSQSRDGKLEEVSREKRPRQDYMDGNPKRETQKGKRPKQEHTDDASSFSNTLWMEEEAEAKINLSEMPILPRSNKPCKSVDQMVAKPPYFFYGNVINVSHESWAKISQFLYALEPEFVNTRSFSALCRKEGYVHNLPIENRVNILPKPPMTLEDVMPHTKRWWPSWDTRKQLSCISWENSGTSQLCDRLEKILTDSRGLLSTEQQSDILHHCKTLNLVWVGHNKLKVIEPEHLERILGYPLNHTQIDETSLVDRLLSLKYCFQIETLAYHLSVLKSMFPEGLTLFSIFSGIGGAEITLHKLGIRLKGVVSVEACEKKRKILNRWWHSSGQTGELVQIEDVHKLTSKKINSLMEKFGGFDLLICQNSSSQSLGPRLSLDGGKFLGFDFSLFYEFVRVLQRLRTMMERKR